MEQSDKATLSSCDSVEVCTIGTPAEPLEEGHPRGVEVHVDEIIHNVVVENFHDDPQTCKEAFTILQTVARTC